MLRHKKKKLIYKFLSFILPFIILSIVITSIVLSLTNYSFFQKTINQDYRNIIKSSSGEIRLFMDNARHNLESLALLIASTKLDSWRKEIALTAFLHTNTQFMSMDLFSADGEKIVTTISEKGVSSDADPEIFNKALSGKVAISGVILAENDLPHVNIAVPVFVWGEVKEVLWAELNLKSVWDVLEGIQVGETGQIYILDLSGRYIAHKEIDKVVRAPSIEKPEALEKILDSETPVEWIDDTKGKTSYNVGAYLPGLDWVVVLTQPVTEIFWYLYRNIFWAVMMTLSICVAAVVSGWLWVRRFLVPIQTLHRQVRIIGQGDLDRKVSIKTEDEIGDLGIAFNEMTDSLKQHIAREVETAKTLEHTKNLAVLGTASSKVTHEVGNFLNNTHMALSGLKREALSERGEKILKIIEKESGRVNEFIQKFLQFAKNRTCAVKKAL